MRSDASNGTDPEFAAPLLFHGASGFKTAWMNRAKTT